MPSTEGEYEAGLGYARPDPVAKIQVKIWHDHTCAKANQSVAEANLPMSSHGLVIAASDVFSDACFRLFFHWSVYP